MSLFENPVLRAPVVLLVVLAVQRSLMVDIRPLGATGDVMLLAAVGAGLAAGPNRGARWGFVIGVLADLLNDTPFGLSALVYTVTAYAVGFIPIELTAASAWLRMMIVAGASAAAIAFYAIVAGVFGVTSAVSLRLPTIILVVAVINALLGPLTVRVQRWALMAGDRARQ
jgi:rod shape-determining protein MreD